MIRLNQVLYWSHTLFYYNIALPGLFLFFSWSPSLPLGEKDGRMKYLQSQKSHTAAAVFLGSTPEINVAMAVFLLLTSCRIQSSEWLVAKNNNKKVLFLFWILWLFISSQNAPCFPRHHPHQKGQKENHYYHHHQKERQKRTRKK